MDDLSRILALAAVLGTGVIGGVFTAAALLATLSFCLGLARQGLVG
jgi:uncharacterized membrane protein